MAKLTPLEKILIATVQKLVNQCLQEYLTESMTSRSTVVDFFLNELRTEYPDLNWNYNSSLGMIVCEVPETLILRSRM